MAAIRTQDRGDGTPTRHELNANGTAAGAWRVRGTTTGPACTVLRRGDSTDYCEHARAGIRPSWVFPSSDAIGWSTHARFSLDPLDFARAIKTFSTMMTTGTRHTGRRRARQNADDARNRRTKIGLRRRHRRSCSDREQTRACAPALFVVNGGGVVAKTKTNDQKKNPKQTEFRGSFRSVVLHWCRLWLFFSFKFFHFPNNCYLFSRQETVSEFVHRSARPMGSNAAGKHWLFNGGGESGTGEAATAEGCGRPRCQVPSRASVMYP